MAEAEIFHHIVYVPVQIFLAEERLPQVTVAFDDSLYKIDVFEHHKIPSKKLHLKVHLISCDHISAAGVQIPYAGFIFSPKILINICGSRSDLIVAHKLIDYKILGEGVDVGIVPPRVWLVIIVIGIQQFFKCRKVVCDKTDPFRS